MQALVNLMRMYVQNENVTPAFAHAWVCAEAGLPQVGPGSYYAGRLWAMVLDQGVA